MANKNSTNINDKQNESVGPKSEINPEAILNMMEDLGNAKKKVEEKQEMLSAVIQTMPDGLDIVDEKLNIVWMSDKFLKIFGEKSIGKRCYEVYKDDKTQCVDCPLKKPIKIGETKSLLTSPVAGGRTYKISHTGMNFQGKKGVLEMFHDVTDEIKVQQEMELHSEIIKNMSEGVYLIGLNDGIIKYANPKFEKMFGYKSGEMIGKNVSIVNAPTDKNPKQTAKEIMDVLKKTGEWHGEVNNIKKNGEKFWCYANVSVMEHPTYGKVLVSVHRDITEQKKAVEELKRVAALKNISLGRPQVMDEREKVATEREGIVGKREETAKGREEIVGKREKIKKGVGREGIAFGREEIVGKRETTAKGREKVVGKREHVATRREAEEK